MTGTMHGSDVATQVAKGADKIRDDLKKLVRIKSINKPEYMNFVQEACKTVVDLFQAAGITTARQEVVEVGGKKTTPFVYADQQTSVANAPTVLLYAHYDVQDVGPGWATEPFTPVDKEVGGDLRVFGRGTADDKSGICMHLGVVRALLAAGPLPVRLKLLIEGEEETGRGVLESFIEANPTDERFKADVVVVADTGNIARGKPALTATLRGFAAVDVTVSTLDHGVHSGQYGGPAPDAFMALTRLLATLHDDKGDVAVPGLARDTFKWDKVDPEEFRKNSSMLPQAPLIGTPPLAEQLYGRPSVNVVAVEGVPGFDKAVNALCPKAKARVSVRLAPSQDPVEALKLIKAHLTAQNERQWRVPLELTDAGSGQGFLADTSGKNYQAALAALKTAYGTAAKATGQGGSIPLVAAFRAANPKSDIILWGCEEPLANIHAPNESLSYAEMNSMTLAETYLMTTAKKESS